MKKIFTVLVLISAIKIYSQKTDSIRSDFKSEELSLKQNSETKTTQQIKPLIILEGMQTTEDAIKNLKPEDIESINVIKDQNATKKYGEKGKNGVIEIFLKKKK